MAISRTARHFLAFLVALLTFAMAPCAQAAPQSGWWWNPDESGRGFFIEIDEGWFFMSGYYYDETGHATWLVTNDPMPEPMSYHGRLLAVSNGQSLVGEYHAPTGPSVAGNVSLEFSDDNHARLDWNGVSIDIERYAFESEQPATFVPFTGWWWNPAEGGRGMSIELQGQHMFVGLYMYEEDGRPVWYVADAMMATPTRFVAPLLQFANGQAMGGAYRAPGLPRTVGTLTIDFTAADRATVTLSEDPPVAARTTATKVGRSKMIEYRTQKEKTPPPRKHSYFGNFHQELVRGGDNPSTIRIDGQLNWTEISLASSGLAMLTPATIFDVGGRVDLALSGVIDQGGEVCSATGRGGQDLFSFDGLLIIGNDRTYRGSIDFALPVTITACGQTMTFPVPLLVRMRGKMESGTIEGDTSVITTGNTIETTHWHFTAGD